MAKTPSPRRRSISKKLRFELFKRDGFSCQYCGAHPPSAILELDHIHPVSDGGSDDADNLVTSCFDCNRGKAANSLGSVPASLSDRASEVAEREEQIRGYYEVLAQKKQRINVDVSLVDDVFAKFVPGFRLSERALVSVRSFVEKLGAPAVIDAMEISCARWSHYDSKIFKYFCGICWARIREAGQ